jgi:uncharacterized protein
LIPKFTNQLSQETSPYLLQHAHNPVNWQAWNEISLQKAIELDKPIILSIGYSACHWCHVMEHESFENEQVAAIMNKHFVCIKVDREERPDVDGIYMDAIQAMGIHGGWPLNVFLMPDKKPFYGGTYFSANKWANICLNISEAFKKNREELQKSAIGFAENLQSSETQKYNLVKIDKPIQIIDFELIANKISVAVDPIWGGINRAPKFPMPSIWRFLLEHVQTLNKDNPQKKQLEVLLKNTLNRMAMGGIFDQIGGGFSRYSVDNEWFCPHFEKMLYDNSQLLSLYAKAYAYFEEPIFKETILQTIAWLKREMLTQEGAFFSAQDADSEGVEGLFYIWSKTEIFEVLGGNAARFCDAYQITHEGNWEHSKNIVWKNDPFLNSEYKSEIDKLLTIRNQRIFPGLDDKVICSWNGLAVSGLIDCYLVLKHKEILDLALNCGNFIFKNFYKNGYLKRTYKNSEARIDGFLEDYAATIAAAMALYSVTFDENWLSLAESLVLTTLSDFYDEGEGFFNFSNKNTSTLIANKIELFDNVVPASNSIMAQNLYHLGVLLSRNDFVDLAITMVNRMGPLIKANADYLSNWASLALKMAHPKIEVVVYGIDYQSFIEQLSEVKKPNMFLLGAKVDSILPLFEARKPAENETLIYICINNTCSLPIKNVAAAIKMLETITI